MIENRGDPPHNLPAAASRPMSLPDQTPRLPKWIFISADAALLGAAWYVAKDAPHPLGATTLITVVGCVALAGILGIIPFLTDYAWTQDQALDERQRSLEALGRTITTAAEQISIAASGLHEITELAHKNLKQADQIPHKLQEKLAEFKELTASVQSDEIDELERELATLRASENDKLETAADKVAKAMADFAKAEAEGKKQLSLAVTALEKSAASQEAALARVRGEAVSAIEAAAAKAVAAIEVAGAACAARLEAAAARVESQPAAKPEPALAPAQAEAPASVAVPLSEPTTPEVPPAASEPAPAEPAPIEPAIEDTPPPTPEVAVEVTPAEPSSPLGFPEPEPEAPAAAPEPVAVAEPSPEPAPKPRKRSPKKVEETAPILPLETPSEEFSQVAPDEGSVQGELPDIALSADGATRVLVTAYIGIGNRLYIRGEGPGLSWDKGVPLQFVSIGKWRWETTEAAAPVQYRLYKNDESECSKVGLQTLEAGHQPQLTAAF